MTTIDLKKLGELHSPEPEPDAQLLKAVAQKLQLLCGRVLALCEAHQAVETATLPTGRSRLAKSDPSRDYGLIAEARLAKSDPSSDYGLIAEAGLARTVGDISSVEGNAKVQQPGEDAFPPGTIWLPISPRFVTMDLPIDVRVMKYVPGDSQNAAVLIPLDVGIAEQYPYGNGGAILTLEPQYWDDPALPAGFVAGRFRALVSLGVVGTVKEPERVLVVIGCMELRRSHESV
jgi:hypothetical protein